MSMLFVFAFAWASIYHKCKAQIVTLDTDAGSVLLSSSQQAQYKSLQTVLTELQTQYEVYLNYELEAVKDKLVDTDLLRNHNRTNLETALQLLLKPHQLTFEKIKNNYYVIYTIGNRKATHKLKNETSSTETNTKPIGLLSGLALMPLTGHAAEFRISGKVTDNSGTGLPGVNVLLKGTTTGTTSSPDGNFTVAIPDDAVANGTLVFSYIGYTTKEVPINNQNTINVSLVQDIKSLGEVVVVGYGTQKKSDLTGSVASLKSEDLNPGANASVDQLMLGRSAGVQITQTSSEPGGGVSVRIRGTSSLNAGNEPLYVIDGLPIDNSAPLSATANGTGTGTNNNPRNPLNALNPNDIESIEILKDASATAIYGSRGANGVILITTKRGVKGKVGVTYDFYTGIQSVPGKLELLSPSDYIRVMNEIAIEEGRSPEFSQSDINQIGAGTDWQDQIFRNAPLSSHNLSASGGDEHTTFFASLNYFNQEGLVKNSGIKKYIARLNLERSFGTKAKIGVNINTSLVKDNNSMDGVNNNENAGPINAALLYDPTEPIYDSDGSFSQSPNLTINNPVSLIEGLYSTNQTNRTLGSIYFSYNLTKDLVAKLNFGSDRQMVRRDFYNSTLTINGASAKGIANIGTLERTNVLLEYTMNYNKQLNESSTINVLGGVTYQYFNNRSFSGTIRNFPSDALATNNLGLGDTNNDNLFSNQEDNSLLSYLSRVNYTLLNKYLFTASLRADGSSRFGENNKFGYFPSVALGWQLGRENFMPDFFSDLKLRGSWGLTGNQDIANYASLTTFTTGANVVLNNAVLVGTRPSRIANPDLKWETTEQINIGLDASIWQGRLSATIDYFVKNTRDMLINLPLPRATGFESILSNVGKMQNKGVELLLSSTNIDKKHFSWSTTVNFSAIKNKVKDLGEVTDIITGNVEAIGPTTIIREGQPAYSYYGYQITGIFQTNDDIAASAQPASKPGYPIFKDVNADNRITPADQIIIGNPFPNFTFGIQNSLIWKRFQLDVFVQGQQGADLLNINVLESMYPNNFRRNRIAQQALNRWTPQNPDTKWPSGVQPSAYGGGKVNTLALQDASYIRLKNIQLGYNLPVEKIKFIQSARVYVTGQNIATFTDYIGFDPEANAFGRSNVRLDYNGYPLARTWMIGLNVGF